jgi:asparagine synthetase B (glutamine-hydrolysing)
MASLAVLRDPDPHRVALVRDMLAASPHRGSVTTVVEHAGCAAGVAVGDDEAGRTARPAEVAVHDDVLVAVEGRVDNLAALAAALDLPAGTTAAAVVARGVRRHGGAFATRMRGRCAVVAFDGRTLLAWRDHLGFAPLFVRTDGRRVAVATEAKQVAVGSGLPLRADLDVVVAAVWGEVDNESPSALRGVDRLPKATVLRHDGSTAARDTYWHPEDVLESRPATTAAAVQDEFDHLMTQACDRVLTGVDVVSLSGGVDSPAVAAYAGPAHLRRFGRRLPALSTLYPDHPEVDESRWIELVARELDLDLETYPHRRDGARDAAQDDEPGAGLTEWSRLFDGPVPTMWIDDMVTNYREVSARGHRSVLTGEMAEFLTDMRQGLLPHLVAHSRWGEVGRRLQHQRAHGVAPHRLARQLAAGMVPGAVLRTVAPYRRGVRLRRRPDWVSVTRARQFGHEAGPRRLWASRQVGMVRGPGLTIEAEDVVSSVHGVVSRRPFADVDLWEFFLGLPAETKFPVPSGTGLTNKPLLRALLRGRVPDPILDRTDKTSFTQAMMDGVDYASLRALLDGDDLVPGIDYRALRARVAAGDLDLGEYVWARKLAWAHAFVRAVP